ncbi:TPA: HIT family protein [Candidatus Woesearchaeota archaeon]|nr:HIT family protein [Candidatus Woesearchaeota archaeon]
MAQQQPTPEQIKELQEKIAKMSPEELKEFQKKQCIFCHIVAGKVQSRKVYEDEHTLAVLDINPANPGHILLLTKEHYSIMPQLPLEVLEHVFLVAKKLSNALLRAVDARGSNIMVANGVAAGQKAQHFIVHIIPRREKDGVVFELPQRQQNEDSLQQIANELAKSLGAPAPKKSAALLPDIMERIKETEHKDHQERKRKHERVPAKGADAPEKPSPAAPSGNKGEEKEKPPKKQPGGDINLDDIARLFGAKK